MGIWVHSISSLSPPARRRRRQSALELCTVCSALLVMGVSAAAECPALNPLSEGIAMRLSRELSASDSVRSLDTVLSGVESSIVGTFPVVPSAESCRWREPHDRGLCYDARHLGRALLRAIRHEIEAIRGEALEAVGRRVDALLRTADLVGEQGYGNVILSRRARDGAVVGLGRLLIESAKDSLGDTGLADLERRISKVAPRSSDDPRQLARVANCDLGCSIFDDESKLDQKKLGMLEGIPRFIESRGTMNRDVRDYFNRAYRDVGIDLTACPENVARNVFDRCALLKTTEECWDVTSWSDLFQPAEYAVENFWLLPDAFLFRKLVGNFPTREAGGNSKILDSSEAVFAEAWRRFDRREYRQGREHVDAKAWRVYSQVHAGIFLDKDSRILVERSRSAPSVDGFRKPRDSGQIKDAY